METKLNTFTLTVSFDPTKIAAGEDPIEITGFTPIPVPLKQLLIPQGISMIVFDLLPLPEGPQPQFPTYPIEWFDTDGKTTISQPDCFQVHWYNPNQCTVVDFNSALEPQSHIFNVVVAYDGKTYGSDPAIVNEPPMQPPGQG